MENYRGRKVTCDHTGCKNEIKDYRTFCDAFSDAIDTWFLGWCIEHEQEVGKHIDELQKAKDRIQQSM